MSAGGASVAGTAAANEPIAPASGGLWQRCYYWFAWGTVMTFFTVFYRFRRYHLERMPREGAVLLVSNHQSHFDPPALGMCVRNRQFRPLARASLFKNRVFGRIIRGLNAIPLRDKEGDIGAIRSALALLNAGEVVSVFPEGARTPDGEIKAFHRGVTLLLRRAQCPVVPMAIEGAFEIWPRHQALPRLLGGRFAVIVGEPISHDELLKDGAEAALERLRGEVVALHGELRRKMARR